MDLRKLKTLIDLVSESGISELEVNEGEDRVRIVNSGSAAHAGQAVYTSPATTQAAQVAPAPSAPAPIADAEEPSETGFVARSPMVGTFYRASNPESPNFVCGGVDHHCFNSQFAARSLDSESNFSPIGNQNLIEHVCSELSNSG
jgi:hypothetical protein